MHKLEEAIHLFSEINNQLPIDFLSTHSLLLNDSYYHLSLI